MNQKIIKSLMIFNRVSYQKFQRELKHLSSRSYNEIFVFENLHFDEIDSYFVAHYPKIRAYRIKLNTGETKDWFFTRK